MIMKILLFILTTLLLSPEEEDPCLGKRAPGYKIVVNKKDKDIEKNKAEVKLYVIDDITGESAEGAEIELLIDGKKREWITDSTGTVIFTTVPGDHEFSVSYEDRIPVTTGLIKIEDRHYVEIKFSMYQKRTTATRKPVLYLYADKETDLELKINPVGNFTFTYPAYKDSWRVKVHTDGQLTVDGKNYAYLFWEAERDLIRIKNDEGFVVSKDETIAFLEDKLSHIGLNSKEINDFIVYWGPELQKNPYNQIYFMFDEDYEKEIGQLESSVKFDSQIRLFMVYKPLKEYKETSGQKLPAFERKGFTLVEWGGGIGDTESSTKTP